MRPLRLATKLSIVVGLLATVIVILAVGAAGYVVFSQTEREIARQLSQAATMIVQDYLEIAKGTIEIAPTKNGEELAADLRTLDLSLYIVNTEGATLAQYGIYRDVNKDQLALLLPRTLLSPPAGGVGAYRDATLVAGTYDTYTIPLRSATTQAGYLQIARPNNVLPLITKTLESTLLIFLPLVWLAAYGATRAGTKLILSPLTRLVDFIEHAEVETLAAKRIELPRADREVGILVRAFNKLLAKVHFAIQSRGQVAENISHEFRTPLTRIASSLAIVVPAVDPASQRIVRKAIKDVVALGSQAESILDLAISAEPGKSETLLAPMVAELFTTVPANIRATSKIPAGFRVPLLPDHTRILLKNLVENAVKYNTPDGKIMLSASETGDTWEVTLANTTREKLEGTHRVFERGWRGNRKSATAGKGLGMAIIQDVARKNNLTVTFRQIANSLVEVRVEGKQ